VVRFRIGVWVFESTLRTVKESRYMWWQDGFDHAKEWGDNVSCCLGEE